MKIEDIPSGESWGCRFRTTTFLERRGQPVEAYNLALGQAHPGVPGDVEGIGVIQVRDVANSTCTTARHRSLRAVHSSI